MSIDRRIFFKTAALITASMAIGKSFAAEKPGSGEVEFYGVLYDSTRCAGCQECERVCAAAVIWRGEKCMGCRYCMVSCPFDVPKFEYLSTNPKIVKCDMCYDRIAKGQVPACVEGCPAEALKFGTRRELIAEARKRIAATPDAYIDEIYGENVAGGTGYLILAAAPFKEMGLNTALQNSSYPELTKGFLYSVPTVDVLLPPLLLGIYAATKNNHLKEEEEND